MDTDKTNDELKTEGLLLSLIFDRLEHRLGVWGFFECLTEFGFVKNLGDVGEGVKMLLKLTLGHEKEHDEVYRLIIEGVEVDALFGSPQCADDFRNQRGGGVRNPDAEPDARAHGFLAFLDHFRDGGLMFRLDFSRRDEIVDQFVNRLPTVGGLQIREDLVFGQDVS